MKCDNSDFRRSNPQAGEMPLSEVFISRPSATTRAGTVSVSGKVGCVAKFQHHYSRLSDGITSTLAGLALSLG